MVEPLAPEILRTKLHCPPLSDDLLQRDRLLQLVDGEQQGRFTLVSAPAGYGKSVLVSQWAESLEVPFAWLSLDSSESDPRQFVAYFVAAIATAIPDACRQTAALCAVSELCSTAVLASHLINEIDAIGERFAVVLDDYHRIDRSSPVHDLLSRLLEHPPRPLHLTLITRRDPPLRLAGLRARGDLKEVRPGDLQFTQTETTSLVTERAGLAVGEQALARLQHEVEGWAAGLGLVLLTLRKIDDPDRFLMNLHGGIPHVQQYLIEEVLARQSPELRGHLLKSSILDRFCPEILEVISPPSVDSVSPLTGREIIGQLRSHGLFMIALDVQGVWYRYHHLFQDLLQQQLQRYYSPSEIRTLHSLASDWFENQGLIAESIKHAMTTGDIVRAAEILERHRYAELEADRWLAVSRWLDLLPADIKQQRLNLLLAQAWVFTFQLNLESLGAILSQAESKVDETVEPALLAELSYFRGLFFYYDGKGEDAQRLLTEALARYPRKRGMIAGEMEMYLALTRHMNGEGERAIADIKDGIRLAGEDDDVYLSRLAGTEAFIHFLSGDLVPLLTAAERVTEVGKRIDATYVRAWGHYLEAAGHFHSFRLEDAMRGFLAVTERLDFVTRKVAVEGLTGTALTHQLMGDPSQAVKAADELLAFTRELAEPEHALAARSCRARLALLQEDLETAVDWARSVEPASNAAAMSFFIDDPSITLARVLIAEGTETGLNRALESLELLRGELEALHCTCQAIDVLVLQALALHELGSAKEARETLAEAVVLGGSRGWVRPFVEPGPSAVRLLNGLRNHDTCADHVVRILRAAGESETERDDTTSARRRSQPLLDPLTNRELEIVELLGERLSDKEIAERLFISPQTVNYHCKHIYQKLGVGNRRQAVDVGLELGVIKRP